MAISSNFGNHVWVCQAEGTKISYFFPLDFCQDPSDNIEWGKSISQTFGPISLKYVPLYAEWDCFPKYAGQKIKISINVFFSKCDQIHSFLQIWLHILKKFLMKILIFCAVICIFLSCFEDARVLYLLCLGWIKAFEIFPCSTTYVWVLYPSHFHTQSLPLYSKFLLGSRQS